LRLRHLLRDEAITPEASGCAESVLDAFSQRKADVPAIPGIIRQAKQKLGTEPPEKSLACRRMWTRLVGTLEEMEDFFRQHPRFLIP
jgi:hypothetical protein